MMAQRGAITTVGTRQQLPRSARRATGWQRALATDKGVRHVRDYLVKGPKARRVGPEVARLPRWHTSSNAKFRFYVVSCDGLDPLTGRERRRWHPAGHDRHEAEQMAERIELDNTGPAPARGGPSLVGESLTDTWLPITRRHAQATTAYRYSWFVDHYSNPALGQVPLRRLRADHLDGLYDKLATTRAATATVS